MGKRRNLYWYDVPEPVTDQEKVIWEFSQVIDLTPTEHGILLCLAISTHGGPVRIEAIETFLWGDVTGYAKWHIGHLRKKVEPYGTIRTRRGFGYELSDDFNFAATEAIKMAGQPFLKRIASRLSRRVLLWAEAKDER